MAVSRKDSRGQKLKDGESQRKDGRYHYTYLDSTGKRKYIYAKTLKDLREKEKDMENDKKDGISGEGRKNTLNQLFLQYMDLKGDLRETTREKYKALWRGNVERSGIGGMKVSDIKQMHVKAFYIDCAKRGLSHNTIKLLDNLIKPTFEMAINNDMVRKNPCKGAMDDIKQDSKEKTPLTGDEVARLLDFCANSNAYFVHVPFLEIAIGTCMRAGELSGLTWNDVDMGSRTINVDHQLIYANLGDGCKFHISDPKTDTGKRAIPMTESVYRAFIQVKKLNMMLGRRSQAEVGGYRDFVFINGNGNPISLNSINISLRNIERAYNKKHPESPLPHLSAHVLRHTGCTLLAAKGIDVKALQNIMGHSDVATTMNIYNHASTERTRAELMRIGEIDRALGAV